VFGLRSAIGRGLEPAGSIVAGLAIAHLAAPTMARGGVGADTLGGLIGTGPERGAAVVLLSTGLALVVVAGWLARSWINAVIDGERSGQLTSAGATRTTPAVTSAVTPAVASADASADASIGAPAI
jgi:hypothetical protein